MPVLCQGRGGPEIARSLLCGEAGWCPGAGSAGGGEGAAARQRECEGAGRSGAADALSEVGVGDQAPVAQDLVAHGVCVVGYDELAERLYGDAAAGEVGCGFGEVGGYGGAWVAV